MSAAEWVAIALFVCSAFMALVAFSYRSFNTTVKAEFADLKEVVRGLAGKIEHVDACSHRIEKNVIERLAKLETKTDQLETKTGEMPTLPAPRRKRK